MDHAEHVNLIRRGVTEGVAAWADFGAGSGASTLALAELLGPRGEIYAVDRDPRALRSNAAAMRARFPETAFHELQADFTGPPALSGLDGVLIANALHFQRDQLAAVRSLKLCLRPGGRVVIVEYNTTSPSAAVPYPVPFEAWQRLALGAGFEVTELLATRRGSFHDMYAAMSR